MSVQRSVLKVQDVWYLNRLQKQIQKSINPASIIK